MEHNTGEKSKSNADDSMIESVLCRRRRTGEKTRCLRSGVFTLASVAGCWRRRIEWQGDTIVALDISIGME